jgi:ribosomal protein S18 acetylase RimI-like enzyme
MEKLDSGLGGIVFREIPVAAQVKDFSFYQRASDYEKQFDISNWAFFMAFDGFKPVGAATVASRTDNLRMLDGRDDLSVLWDIRVATDYKRQGVGQKLFDLAAEWSKNQGLKQMKIECQNNNVPACRFYHKQGAVLGKIDAYAYFSDPAVKDEIQLIWYLDL